MRPARSKPYRRSWKNLLLNKRYQLGFTLFMVGLSAVLMLFLGYWVMREADRATSVAINNVDGQRCPPVPEFLVSGAGGVIIDEITEMKASPDGAPDGAEGMETEGEATEVAVTDGEATEAADAEGRDTESTDKDGEDAEDVTDTDGEDAEDVTGTDGEGDEGAGAEVALANGEEVAGRIAPAAAPEPAGAAGAEREAQRQRVVLDEGTVLLDLPPVVPSGFVEAVIQHYRCQHDRVSKIAGLHTGYQRILLVLISAGVLLIFGLTFIGIKMTHRLAGPLYKVQLYFAKMEKGQLDDVYDLRKGDQLVEFYEHFKAAHEGIKTMQREDLEHLRAVIEAAEAEDLAARSPEIAAVLDELRETLARKEKSLE